MATNSRLTVAKASLPRLHGLVTLARPAQNASLRVITNNSKATAAVYERVTTLPVSSAWSTNSVARRAEPVDESEQVGALASDSTCRSRHVDLLVLWFRLLVSGDDKFCRVERFV